MLTKEVWNKIDYLDHHPHIMQITGFPDLEDDEGGLNGFLIESNETVFPIGAGFDMGCGFRVIHIPRKWKEVRLELNFLHQCLTNGVSGFPIDINDINMIMDDPINWLNMREVIGKSPEYPLFEYDQERPTHLSLEEVSKNLVQIPSGNHFVEFRYVHSIEDTSFTNRYGIYEGDLMVFIHSGSDISIKRTFMRYFAMIHARLGLGNIKLNYNGYKVQVPLQTDLAQEFLADAERASRLAFANRSAITHIIAETLQSPVQVLLDNTHSSIRAVGNKVQHRHSVQTYMGFKGEDIAVIAGTASHDCVLVKRSGQYPFLNHGVGSGGDQEADSYFNIEEVLSHGSQLGWYHTVLRIHPWLAMRNN
ncbi:RtcB family protein [Ectobacillus funiculus]